MNYKNYWKLCWPFLFFFLHSSVVFGFKDNSLSLGVGYFSQNIMNKVANSPSGSSEFLGEPNYLLNLKYDLAISSTWFLGTQLGYSVLPRSAAGSTADVTLLHLAFLFGQDFGSTGSEWDWYFGPGILKEDIKGKGGTKVMNNGTSTAVFALPGDTRTVQNISSNLGVSWTGGQHRLGLDFIILNLLNSDKRAQNLMLSYGYVFSGGIF